MTGKACGEGSLLSLKDIVDAREKIRASGSCVRTPMLTNVEQLFGRHDFKLHLKLENMQTAGSFKIRGTINQLSTAFSKKENEGKTAVTVSAGNYGKAMAYYAKKIGVKGYVLMPEDAPLNRIDLIKNYGCTVERVPKSELEQRAHKYCQEQGMLLMHSYNDLSLMAGHGSLGLEIIEDLPNIDVLIIPCGGGGLIAGVAAAVRLSGHTQCRIYGVEPEGSNTMYQSFQTGSAVGSFSSVSCAAGLSPPSAGALCYELCRQFVTDILLITDDELKDAMRLLYSRGLLVEIGGAAGVAALFNGKVPDVAGKNVAVVLSGSNVTPEELLQFEVKPSVP